jgi:L-ascorbate metabolism protein UlaG (beta-lactamase superfamily)
MHISWLGGTAIRIQTKPGDDDVVLVVDPYRQKAGAFPRSLAPNIALFTRGREESITLSGDPFVLDTPGECETKGVLVSATYAGDTSHLFVRFDSEGLACAHLGLTDRTLTEAELDMVGGVDILFLPIGATGAYDAENAVKAVNAIEPRIVIPIAFASDNDPAAGTADAFLREMGVKAEKPETKVIIKKKDLPQEETRVIVLEKEK